MKEYWGYRTGSYVIQFTLWAQILFITNCPGLTPSPSLIVAWLNHYIGTLIKKTGLKKLSLFVLSQVDLDGIISGHDRKSMWQECVAIWETEKSFKDKKGGKMNLWVINISQARKNLAHFKMESKTVLKKTRIFHNFNCTSFSKCALFKMIKVLNNPE